MPPLILLITFLCADVAWAEISIALKADRARISANEELRMEVVVDGVRSAPQPHFPKSDAFTLEARGSSSRVNIINFKMQAQAIFSYSLFARKEGEIVVGPATIEVDGKTYRSEALRVRVLKAAEQAPENKLFFVEAKIDQPSPVVHQQILYTFRFYSRAQVANADLDLPEFEGFWHERLGKERNFHAEIDGQNWQVTEVKYALFPDRPGKLTIGEARLALEVFVQGRTRRRSFFDSFVGRPTKRVNLRTQPVELAVQPLPAPPQGVDPTQLVGRMSLSTKVTERNPKVGDSITLTVALDGRANVWDAQLDSLDVKNARIYADKPQHNKRVEKGALWGAKEFKFAIVPQREGELELPPIRFHYFNPETMSYEVAESQSLPLQVGAGEDPAKLAHVSASPRANSKEKVKVLGTDLMPIIEDPAALKGDLLTTTEVVTLASTAAAAPLLYLTAFGLRRRQHRLARDGGYRRRERALRELQARASRLKRSERFFNDASEALRGYLGDRFNVASGALTAKDVIRIIPSELEELATECGHLLSRCDAGLYGGGEVSDSERDALIERISGVCRSIEKRVR